MSTSTKPIDRKVLALLATADLTGEQFSRLTGEQFSWLTGEQFSRLTGEQFSRLTGEQLSWLTREQFSWLTREQKIPAVPDLYSKILSDIEAEKRVLDQRSFGPDDGVSEENVCKTPMCIAGHTVNLAGQSGYELSKALGFGPAALLIHRASCPNTPAPRYDSYPSDWALAYIEARAAEEAAAENKKP